MELLQNYNLKPDEIKISFLHEIKIQMESILELCQEGEISVSNTATILHKELLCTMRYRNEVWDRLVRLENEKAVLESKYKEIVSNKEDYSYSAKMNFEYKVNMTNESLDYIKEVNFYMNKYHLFINADAWEKLQELHDLLRNNRYRKKRKTRIKQQIIRNGLDISAKAVNDTDNKEINNKKTPVGQKIDISISQHNKDYLVSHFPQFAKDYPLLIEKGFFVETNTGLRRSSKRSKQFLTDYFKSIKPKDKKLISWSMLESVLNEKFLKNSASSNGNVFEKNISKDFKEWLQINNSKYPAK